MSVLKGETQDHIHVLAGGSKIPGKKMPLPHVRCKILVKAAQTKISSFFPPFLLPALHFVHIFHIFSLQYATTTRSGFADQLSGQIFSVICGFHLWHLPV